MLICWAVLGGFVLDAIFGDPAWLPHPVVLMGKAITALEKRLRAQFPQTPQGELCGGAVLAAILPVGTFLITALVCRLAAALHPLAGLAVQMFWCAQALAARGLVQESRNVYKELQKQDLPAARKAVARIVGRDTQNLTAECAGAEFVAKGCIIRQAGWRAVYGEEEKEETIIPGWHEGDTLTLKAASITEGKTKPKPLHTEATLLSAMETAGKEIEDDALRQALKDCGIGTPATRAAIIETLFKRGYMERCKKSLVPTEKGLALYSVVKTMRIADVAMTGEWEKELARIERGELPADTFRKEIEAYTREITSELLSCDKLFARRDSGCKCPKCGTGSMQFYGKVVRCDNADCGLPVFRLKANRTLSDDEIKELLTDGHTKPLKGFKSKQGKNFDAIVAFDGEYNTTFVFPEKKCKSSYPKKRK